MNSGIEVLEELVEINELSEESRSLVVEAGRVTVLAVLSSFVGGLFC